LVWFGVYQASEIQPKIHVPWHPKKKAYNYSHVLRKKSQTQVQAIDDFPEKSERKYPGMHPEKNTINRENTYQPLVEILVLLPLLLKS
jgi:hypothetical protein